MRWLRTRAGLRRTLAPTLRGPDTVAPPPTAACAHSHLNPDPSRTIETGVVPAGQPPRRLGL
jgi:hypothetical protein